MSTEPKAKSTFEDIVSFDKNVQKQSSIYNAKYVNVIDGDDESEDLYEYDQESLLKNLINMHQKNIENIKLFLEQESQSDSEKKNKLKKLLAEAYEHWADDKYECIQILDKKDKEKYLEAKINLLKEIKKHYEDSAKLVSTELMMRSIFHTSYELLECYEEVGIEQGKKKNKNIKRYMDGINEILDSIEKMQINYEIALTSDDPDPTIEIIHYILDCCTKGNRIAPKNTRYPVILQQTLKSIDKFMISVKQGAHKDKLIDLLNTYSEYFDMFQYKNKYQKSSKSADEEIKKSKKRLREDESVSAAKKARLKKEKESDPDFTIGAASSSSTTTKTTTTVTPPSAVSTSVVSSSSNGEIINIDLDAEDIPVSSEGCSSNLVAPSIPPQVLPLPSPQVIPKNGETEQPLFNLGLKYLSLGQKQSRPSDLSGELTNLGQELLSLPLRFLSYAGKFGFTKKNLEFIKWAQQLNEADSTAEIKQKIIGFSAELIAHSANSQVNSSHEGQVRSQQTTPMLTYRPLPRNVPQQIQLPSISQLTSSLPPHVMGRMPSSQFSGSGMFERPLPHLPGSGQTQTVNINFNNPVPVFNRDNVPRTTVVEGSPPIPSSGRSTYSSYPLNSSLSPTYNTGLFDNRRYGVLQPSAHLQSNLNPNNFLPSQQRKPGSGGGNNTV